MNDAWKEIALTDRDIDYYVRTGEYPAGVSASQFRLAIGNLALKALRPEEERATRWMVATLTERGYLIEGHPYVSQKSAQQDANLILARGERAEVWACTRCEPQREETK